MNVTSGQAMDPARPYEPGPVKKDKEVSNAQKWLSYLYFTRFSILLWVSMIGLIFLNLTGVAAATLGILTLERWEHFIFCAFFIVIAGWTALLGARITCAYGKERFGFEPPSQLQLSRGKEMSLRTFLLAQVPGLFLLAYIAYLSHKDGLQPLGGSICYMFLGALGALVFWYILGAYYYWAYETTWDRNEQPERGKQPERDQSGTEALSFVVPYVSRVGLKDLHYQPPPPFARALNPLFRALARIGFLGNGYVKQQTKGLHSGHSLAVLTLLALVLLYAGLFPMTAPIRLRTAEWILRIVVLALAVAWSVRWLDELRVERKQVKLSLKSRIFRWSVRALILTAFIIFSFLPHSEQAFPVIASVYAILLMICWLLMGAAFFLDKFRVPILAVILLVIIAENGLANFDAYVVQHTPHWVSRILPQQNDHYFEVLPLTSNICADPQSPTCPAFPETVARRFVKSKPARQPMIVVTSTGGGIHAAVWTTEILSLLEQQFKENQFLRKHSIDFHDSILLMSTVSGGSVGAMPWLQEYVSQHPFSNLGDLSKAAGCSSLEAVGWGFLYPDTVRLVYPYRLFSAMEPYDRGWALQHALARNMHDDVCQTKNREAPRLSLLSLTEALNSGAHSLPAFSMNATAAETGGRFLLANYQLPEAKAADSEVMPAQSYLQTYAAQDPKKNEKRVFADLPLSSAAHLSSTFPYVSPMPRIPRFVSDTGSHFGDGGYFDNDGTATAIEFLYSAFNSNDAPDADVLLIEIRDGPNPAPTPDSFDAQKKNSSTWGPLLQYLGPLETFYAAGHTSVTRRNRRELCMLEGTLGNKVSLTHVVFDFVGDGTSPQPLSWHLTAQQKTQLDAMAKMKAAQAKATANWYAESVESGHVASPGCELSHLE